MFKLQKYNSWITTESQYSPPHGIFIGNYYSKIICSALYTINSAAKNTKSCQKQWRQGKQPSCHTSKGQKYNYSSNKSYSQTVLSVCSVLASVFTVRMQMLHLSAQQRAGGAECWVSIRGLGGGREETPFRPQFPACCEERQPWEHWGQGILPGVPRGHHCSHCCSLGHLALAGELPAAATLSPSLNCPWDLCLAVLSIGCWLEPRSGLERFCPAMCFPKSCSPFQQQPHQLPYPWRANQQENTGPTAKCPTPPQDAPHEETRPLEH